ncbi:hypothetical protein [Dictyobacter alpinus]|nr:hypothetical protein [Dictyobacter alpinus]
MALDKNTLAYTSIYLTKENLLKNPVTPVGREPSMEEGKVKKILLSHPF